MTYPTGSDGYGLPSQDPRLQGYTNQVPSYAAVPPAGTGRGLPFLFNIGVIFLGILSFVLGFAPYVKESGTASALPSKSSLNFFDNLGLGVGLVGLSLLLVAALVAAFGLFPKQPSNEPVVAALSLGGFLSLVVLLICLADVVDAGIGLILVLVSSFLQAALAIGSLLFSAGIIRSGLPSQYGYYPQRGYGQPPPYLQQPQAPYYGAAPGSAPTYQPPGFAPQEPGPNFPPEEQRP